jgi:uncharacterized protein YndB with AHSA1/START domain
VSHVLRFERVFDAAPGEVFDALTDPEGLHEMYGLDEPGWIVESEGEVCIGGAWRVAFGPSREELHRFVHTYKVIDRPRGIVYAVTQTDRDGSSFETSVEISLKDLADGKTLMMLVERGFPSAEERDFHETGLPNAFERVGRFVRERAWDA